MPKKASRYGFVLRNQTNLNRPRIGESEAKPESRVAGHLERMPKEASRYGFVLRNQTNLKRPRIGESEAKPESRVAGHLERMPKEASRYGFVLRNHTNLNRPRIGESQTHPMSEQLIYLLLLRCFSTIIINQLAMAGLPLRVVGQLRFRGGGEQEAEEEEVPEQDPPVQVAARAPEDKAETPTPKRKIQFGIGKFFGSPEAKSSAKPVGDTSITPQSRPTKRKTQLVDQLMIEQLAEKNAELEALLPGANPEEVYKKSRSGMWKLRRRSQLALAQRKRGPKRELTAAKKLLIIQRLKQARPEHDPQSFWKLMQEETGLRKEQLSHLLRHEDDYVSLSQMPPVGRNKASNKRRKRASGAGRKPPFPEVRNRLSDWLELQRACGVTVTPDHLVSHSFALLKESAQELLDRAASDKSLSPLQVGKLKVEAQQRKDKVNTCLNNIDARRSWGRYLLKWIGAKHLTTDLVQPLDENEAAIRCQLTWQEFDHRLWLSSCSSVLSGRRPSATTGSIWSLGSVIRCRCGLRTRAVRASSLPQSSILRTTRRTSLR